MIPRIEEKIEVARIDYPNVIAWLSNNGFTVLHPKRVVNSIYFDNHQMQMLFDAQEGITPRRKIRARYYGHSSLDLNTKNISIEIKQSAASGRSKSIKTNEDIKKALSMGLIDKIYGLCLPVVKISYVREYFKYKDWRLTLDRDIIYEKLGNSPYGVRSTIDPCFVLEIKTSIDQDKNILRNFFNFPRSKFSKYERAFEYLAS